MIKLSQIADVVSELEFSDRDAERLIALMNQYKSDAQHTFRGLYKIPGFKKLWDALDEAARFNNRGDADAGEKNYGIWCEVSGGVAGHRVGWMKRNGAVAEFTKDEAEAEADRLQKQRDVMVSSASYRYTARQF